MSLFITFEGPDGSGKSTQVRRLYERLEAAGYPVIRTKEPGGTPISDMIRRILLDFQLGEMDAVTETLLFAAARAQHVSELIRPFLSQGGIVVCDRYADSTYAYQGYGLGRDLDELRVITRLATGGLMPDVTIYLDLPVDEGLERKRNALASPLSPPGDVAAVPEWNRLDAREIAFHQRVRQGYLALIAAEPERWLRFDAHLDRDTLANVIWERVEPYLARRASSKGVDG
jgi:dTMP kinase